ncbi:MAG: hypothetical protein ABW189_05675 [Rickettsiales bacterium]
MLERTDADALCMGEAEEMVENLTQRYAGERFLPDALEIYSWLYHALTTNFRIAAGAGILYSPESKSVPKDLFDFLITAVNRWGTFGVEKHVGYDTLTAIGADVKTWAEASPLHFMAIGKTSDVILKLTDILLKYWSPADFLAPPGDQEIRTGYAEMRAICKGSSKETAAVPYELHRFCMYLSCALVVAMRDYGGMDETAFRAHKEEAEAAFLNEAHKGIAGKGPKNFSPKTMLQAAVYVLNHCFRHGAAPQQALANVATPQDMTKGVMRAILLELLSVQDRTQMLADCDLMDEYLRNLAQDGYGGFSAAQRIKSGAHAFSQNPRHSVNAIFSKLYAKIGA